MFNSQKVNNDPYPYTVNWGSFSRCDKPLFHGKHEPRPEYDNNPNPLLEAFRDFLTFTGMVNLQEKTQNVLDNEEVWDLELHQGAHITHARKVLERLVNVYGTD